MLAAAFAITVSAGFGDGLYGNVDWMVSSARWHVPVAGVCAAGLALACVFRSNGLYLVRFSPRSSIASPTFAAAAAEPFLNITARLVGHAFAVQPLVAGHVPCALLEVQSGHPDHRCRTRAA